MNRRALGLIAPGAVVWLLFQWTVHPAYRPVEVSLDLNRLELQSALSGAWTVVPSAVFRGLMDIFVSDVPASVEFMLPSQDLYWLRTKVRFISRDQALDLAINGHPLGHMPAAQAPAAQKFACHVPADYVTRGLNHIVFSSSTKLRVVVEEIEMKNYRSRAKELAIFIVSDRSRLGRTWARIRWGTWWLLAALVIMVNTLRTRMRRGWMSVLGSRSEPVASMITAASLGVPLLIPVGMLVGSLVTPYTLTMSAKVFWVVWVLGAALIQAVIGTVVAMRWVWAMSWAHPLLVHLSVLARRAERLRPRFPARVVIWARLCWLFILETGPIVRALWRRLIREPQRWFAAYVIGTALGGFCLIVQAVIYAISVRQPGKIVDMHGAYPWFRRAAETAGDIGLLALLGFVFLTAFRPHRRRTRSQAGPHARASAVEITSSTAVPAPQSPRQS